MPDPASLTRRVVLGAGTAAALTACSGDPESAPRRTASASPTPSPTPTPSSTAPAPSLPEAPDPLTLPTLMRERTEGGPVDRIRETGSTDAYRRFEVRYPSYRLTVSGVLLVPRGGGRHPGIVLNHGYIEPSIYVTGQGLRREQDALARAGFVVLHTDYRGHAGSGAASALDRETRLGYTRDAIHAVQALRRSPVVDPSRLAVLGRSMGGGVTYNLLVAWPGLVRAAVVYAPVSSLFRDNFERWTRPERPDAAAAFEREVGSPAAAPAVWRALSARTYLARVTEPLLIHHGTSDDSCPIRWSRATQQAARAAGVDSRLEVYDGEQHAFGPQWPRSMDTTISFLRERLA